MKKIKKNTTVWILAFLCIANIILIFLNSIPSSPESQETSEKILEIVEPILNDFIEEERVTSYLIRKCAHVVEFFCLGTLLTLLFQRVNKSVLPGCHIGLVTALTDETIQIFSNRGAKLQDVWLDYLSVIAAVILVWLINKIRNHSTKNIPKEKTNEKEFE